MNPVLKICSPSSLHDKRLFQELQEANVSIDRPSSPVQMATLGTKPPTPFGIVPGGAAARTILVHGIVLRMAPHTTPESYYCACYNSN